ncbi:anti-sigma factor antagonist [Succinimonas amylolytica]|uniref:anti-sigma factor antagonist n=1 Tax=Succinimonas amylolytica TaxID=83769 RepID=UPI00036676F6|nr:anti-sigma factor antagonist [Succinimonas amylolytica]
MELTGRIETSNAEEWKEKIVAGIPESGDYVLECSGLSYISSSGIRIIIKVYKELKKRGDRLIISNVSPAVMEVLDLTGVSEFVTFN